jgi:hypothetical protein
VIIKREDGTRYKIDVRSYYDNYSNSMRYPFDVLKCLPKKRKFRNVVNTDDWEYRCLTMDQRRVYEKELQLLYVTKEEIYAAKIDVWNSLKPSI